MEYITTGDIFPVHDAGGRPEFNSCGHLGKICVAKYWRNLGYWVVATLNHYSYTSIGNFHSICVYLYSSIRWWCCERNLFYNPAHRGKSLRVLEPPINFYSIFFETVRINTEVKPKSLIVHNGADIFSLLFLFHATYWHWTSFLNYSSRVDFYTF